MHPWPCVAYILATTSMAVWVGGAEGRYDDPIPRLQAATEEERPRIMAPKCLIEVGMYDRSGVAKGIAVLFINKITIPRKCDGHYAVGYDLACDDKYRQRIRAHSKKDGLTATYGPGSLYHFCTTKREACCTLTHRTLSRPDCHGMTWKRLPVVHVDLYSHIGSITKATPDAQAWLGDWRDIVDRRLRELQRRLTTQTAWCPLDGFYSTWPPCITKDETYEEWLKGEDELYYMKYTDDLVEHAAIERRRRSLPKLEKAADARNKAKQQKAEQRDVNLVTCCRCGRPPANTQGELFWCLLCSKPTGEKEADEAGMVPFGSAPREEAEERCEEDLVWSFEGGSWQLVPDSAVETEYTRAFRRKAHFSREYINAYLYMQRIGEQGWLDNFDELEAWLDQHPGDFAALPKYPSRHAKEKQEKRLSLFVEQNSWLKGFPVEEDGSPRHLAQQRLLVSLDGWSVDISQDRISIHGRKSSAWAVMYEEAKAWRFEHKTNPKRQSSDPAEKKLASWLHKQQKLRKQGKLSEQRRSFIEGDSMQETRWEQSFCKAQFYFAQHDAALQMPRKNASDAEEKSVANFLQNQIKRFSKLSATRRKQLVAESWWKHAKKIRAQSSKKRPAASTSSCAAVLKRPASALRRKS